MATPHREKDQERFDHWANTYEDSWLQRAWGRWLATVGKK
jgi:hypothetical protein